MLYGYPVEYGAAGGRAEITVMEIRVDTGQEAGIVNFRVTDFIGIVAQQLAKKFQILLELLAVRLEINMPHNNANMAFGFVSGLDEIQNVPKNPVMFQPNPSFFVCFLIQAVERKNHIIP